jgi:hypothetical protein
MFVDDRLHELSRLLDEVQAESMADVTDARLQARVDLVREMRVRLEAEELRGAGEWDRRRLWAASGARSARAELARRWGIGLGAAGDRLEVAARLREAPLTRAAFARGELYYEKVRALTTAVAPDVKPEVKDVFRECEASLLEAASNISYAKVRELMAFWHAHADPDGERERYNNKYDRRGLSVSKTLDGMVAIDGLLDPETGQLVLRALEWIQDQLWRGEHHKAKTLAKDSPAPARGCVPEGAPLRNRRQLCADALGELCRIALGYDRRRDTFDGRAHDRPRITAIVDAEVVAGGDGQAMLGDLLTPIPPSAAQRLLCDARLSTVITNHQFLPLAVSRSAGDVTAAQRRAVILRDGTCAFPGCELPPRCCDVHHIHERHCGGQHDINNIALLCHRHHRLVHDQGWTCWIDPATGRPCFQSPDGLIVRADPSPLQVAGLATRSRPGQRSDRQGRTSEALLDERLPLVS